MNKTLFLALSCASLYGFDACASEIQRSKGAQEESDKEQLEQAQESCNLLAYQKALQSGKFSPSMVNSSLYSIISKCKRSGELNELVKANLQHGGDVNHDFGVADRRRIGGWYGDALYDSSLIGVLARDNHTEEDTSNLPAAQHDDICKTVNTLAKHGSPIDEALLESVAYANYPVTQALITLGANPHKYVKVDIHNPVPESASRSQINVGLRDRAYFANNSIRRFLVNSSARDYRKATLPPLALVYDAFVVNHVKESCTAMQVAEYNAARGNGRSLLFKTFLPYFKNLSEEQQKNNKNSD